MRRAEWPLWLGWLARYGVIALAWTLFLFVPALMAAALIAAHYNDPAGVLLLLGAAGLLAMAALALATC